jgi:hypothetical protein
MGYKLKKHELICIAEYVTINKDNKNISDEQLVSNFYEMLMHALDSQKNTDTDSSENPETNCEDYIEIDSDDDTYCNNQNNKKKKDKK